jgi:hypothetical protein
MFMKIEKAAKLILLPVMLVFFMAAGDIYAGKVVLPEGTEIKINFDPNMKISSGKLQKGIPLLVYLAEDVTIGGEVIIEAGAEGKAEVLEITPASKPGKPGHIKVGFIELSPKGKFIRADASTIPIMGEIEAEGKGKKLLSYIFIFGLFIKGGQGTIPTDAVYPAKIKETVIMQSE